MEDRLTRAEALARQYRVSLKDPGHLKRWLLESNRRWIVFDAVDLVDSLPFPEGVDDFVRVVACYLNHRATKPSGRVEIQKDPVLGEEVEVQIMKTDVLEVEELDRCIRYLISLASEKDPKWKLENNPL